MLRRFSALGSVAAPVREISLIAWLLIAGPAAAQPPQYSYQACVCHYGYGGNKCTVTIGCEVTGGRCAGRCGPLLLPELGTPHKH